MATGGRLFLKRTPGTPQPTREQAQAAWFGISELRHHTTHDMIVGAYAAAEWTMGLTDSRPYSSRAIDPGSLEDSVERGDGRCVARATEAVVVDELAHVSEVLEGRRQGDEDLALGVFTWLAWWMGYRDMPDQFVAGSDEWEAFMSGHAA